MITLAKLRKLRKLLWQAEYRRGLRRGIPAATEHESLIRSLRVGTLIDVGANIGQFTLLTNTIHPQAAIFAFEPLSAPARRFSSFFKGKKNIKLFNYAATDSHGTADINISAKIDSSSLLPISQLQNQIFPGTAHLATEKITTCRIDDIIADSKIIDPLLVKLDVQGSELTALKGMPKLLRRAAYVYLEVSFKELYTNQPHAHDIIAWLSEKNFKLIAANNLVLANDGTSVQADFLFENKSGSSREMAT